MQPHRISLRGYDEARAGYLEALAQMGPEEARARGEAEPTPEVAAEYQRRANEIRSTLEHAGDWIEIHPEKPFGLVLDVQAALAAGDFAGRATAVLRNAIVRWQYRGEDGGAVSDAWIRGLPGDLGLWLRDEINEHYEEVRRRGPKASASST